MTNSEPLIVKESIQKEKITKKAVKCRIVTANCSKDATKNSRKTKNTADLNPGVAKLVVIKVHRMTTDSKLIQLAHG